MNILVLNCGSSSLKFQVIETDLKMIAKEIDKPLARGMIERIGGQALITLQGGATKEKQVAPIRDHREAVDYVLRWLISPESKLKTIASAGDVHAVGHRVVHGAEQFQKSAKITPAVSSAVTCPSRSGATRFDA